MITPLTENQTEYEYRHQWISEAAFYKAMSRDFKSGFELDDWLCAEREFIKTLTSNYHIVSTEDGGLTRVAIMRFAKLLGIENADTFDQKEELIHAIQIIMKNQPCYDNHSFHHCDQDEPCLWRNDCKKLIAQHL